MEGEGLQVSASLGLPIDADISSDDPAVVAAGVRLLDTALEKTAEMGGTDLCGVLYGSMRKHLAPCTATGRANSAAAIGELGRKAEGLGVRIALEVVNRYESNILNTGRQALTYLEEVGTDWVKVHLDTYHMNIEESDLFQPFLDTGTQLGYVHIGESHRGYLGSGTVDFDQFFRGLALTGYDGPITFESFSTAVVDDILSVSLAVWRNLWDDSDDLGRHANDVIRGTLRAVDTIAMH